MGDIMPDTIRVEIGDYIREGITNSIEVTIEDSL
jgi:hypothetical protein